MRKVGFLTVWLVGVSLLGGGCAGDPAGRIASLEAAVTHAETALAIADDQAAALQAQLTAAQAAGSDSKTLAELQAALTAALAQKPGVEQFLAEARASLEKAKADPTTAGEIELYASMGLSALGIFLTAWFKRKATQEAQKAEGRSIALRAVTDAVDASGEAGETVKANVLKVATDRRVYDTVDAVIDQHRNSKAAK